MNGCLQEPKAVNVTALVTGLELQSPGLNLGRLHTGARIPRACSQPCPGLPICPHPGTAYHAKQEERGQGGVWEDSEGLGLQGGGAGKASGGHSKVRWRRDSDEELHAHVGEHLGHLQPPVGTTNKRDTFT